MSIKLINGYDCSCNTWFSYIFRSYQVVWTNNKPEVLFASIWSTALFCFIILFQKSDLQFVILQRTWMKPLLHCKCVCILANCLLANCFWVCSLPVRWFLSSLLWTCDSQLLILSSCYHYILFLHDWKIENHFNHV